MQFRGWQIRFAGGNPLDKSVRTRLLKRRTSSGSGRETNLLYRIRNVAESPHQGTVFEGTRFAIASALSQGREFRS